MKRNTFILGSWSSDATVHDRDPLRGGKSPRSPLSRYLHKQSGVWRSPETKKKQLFQGLAWFSWTPHCQSWNISISLSLKRGKSWDTQLWDLYLAKGVKVTQPRPSRCFRMWSCISPTWIFKRLFSSYSQFNMSNPLDAQSHVDDYFNLVPEVHFNEFRNGSFKVRILESPVGMITLQSTPQYLRWFEA